MSVKLYYGDCLEVLPGIPDGSVDAIVTDPPYGQTNESYDGPIAFDPAVWRECYRVAGPNAAMISFAGSPTYHRIASAIEAGGWKVRQMWGWVYRDGLITSAWPKEGFDRLRPAFDPIVFATKGKVLLRLRREGQPWDRLTGRNPSLPSFSEYKLSNRNGTERKRVANGHYPACLAATNGTLDFEYFAMSRTNGGSTEQHGHPNQKPIALMRWLASKLPGGTLLDPFMGSGSTGVAAIADGFGFIGMEQDPEYFAIAERRIAAAQSEPPLFVDANASTRSRNPKG